jgi:CRP-like cAMP-binding protein
VQSIKTLDINLKVGDYFGERALMYHEVRAADVLATSDVVCYTISKSVFDMVLGSLKDLLEQNLRMTLLKSLDVFAALDPSDLNGVAKALVPMEFEEDDEVICAGYVFLGARAKRAHKLGTGHLLVRERGDRDREERASAVNGPLLLNEQSNREGRN